MAIPTYPVPLNFNQTFSPPTPNKFIITSSSPTAITNIFGPTVLLGIYTTGSGLTAYLRIFDEGIGATGSNVDCVWGDGTSGTTLSAASPVIFHNGVRLYNGLSYSITGTLTATQNIILIVQ